MKTLIKKHPWVALLGFFPPVWLIGVLWTLVSSIKGMAQSDPNDGMLGPLAFMAAMIMFVWALAWPLALYIMTKQENETRDA